MSQAIEDVEKTEQSQDLARILTESTGTPLAIISRKGDFIYLSPSFSRLVGYCPGPGSESIFCSKLGGEPVFKKYWRRAKKTNRATQYGPIGLADDAGEQYIAGLIVPADDKEDSPMVMTALDVTSVMDRQALFEESDRRLGALVEKMGPAIIFLDREGTVLTWSKQTEAMFCIDKAEALGRNIADVIEPEAAFFKKALDGISAGEDKVVDRRVMQNRDESRFFVNTSVLPIESLGRVSGFVCVFEDVTEQSITQRRQARLIESLEGLKNVGLTMSADLDLNARAQDTLDQLASLMPDGFAFIVLYDQAGIGLTCSHAAGLGDANSQVVMTAVYKDSVFDKAAMGTDTMVLTAWDGEDFPPAIKSLGPKAMALVPLKTQGDRRVGALAVGSTSQSVFKSAMMDFLAQAADLLAATVANCLDHKQAIDARDYYKELFESGNNIIFLLDPVGTIIDASPSVKQVTGIAKSELMGTRLKDLVSKAWQDDVERELETLLEGKESSFALEINAGGSRSVSLAVDARPVTLRGRNLFILACRDSSKENRERAKSRVIEAAATAGGAIEDGDCKVIAQALEGVFGPCNICIYRQSKKSFGVKMQSCTGGLEAAWQELEDMMTTDGKVSMTGVDKSEEKGVGVLYEQGVRALIKVPLTSETGPMGLMVVGIEEDRGWNEDDEDFLTSVGQVLARAMDREKRIAKHKDIATRFEAVIDSLDEAVLLIDDSGIIGQANQPAARMFGCSDKKSLIQKNFHELISREDGGSLSFGRNNQGGEWTVKIRAGQEKEQSLARMKVTPASGQKGLEDMDLVLIRDLSQQEEGKAESEKRNDKLKRISEIDGVVAASIGIKKVANVVLGHIVEMTSGIAGAMYFENREDPRWLFLAAQAGQAGDVDWPVNIKIGEGMTGMAAASGVSSEELDEGGQRCVNVPLMDGDDLVGVITLIGGKSEHGVRDVFDDEVKTAISKALKRALVYNELKNNLLEAEAVCHEYKNRDFVKSELLGLAGKELRAPFARITGDLEALTAGALGELGDVQRKKIESLRSRVDDASGLLTSLMDYSELETDRFVLNVDNVGINDLVTHVTDTIHERAQKSGHKLKTDIELTGQYIKADESALTRALANIGNGLHRYCHRPCLLSILAHSDYEELAIDFTLDGIIDEGDLARAFDPFSITSLTLTTSDKTASIGLVVAKEIVRKHNGRIWWGQSKGQTTCVSIRLPLAHGGYEKHRE